MEISNAAVENGSHETEREMAGIGTEVRSYRLNEEKAMEKKLLYTQRDEIHVEESGGGLKLRLNTGMYELIKSRVESYFSTESLRYSYTYTPVTDNRGSIVETRYKVAKGKSYMYTLNMYHTKCSYLVNGRNPLHFVKTDLPSILETIVSELNSCDTSVSKMNEDIRNMLLQLKQNEPNIRQTNYSASDILCISESDIEPQALPPLLPDPRPEDDLPIVNAHTRDSIELGDVEPQSPRRRPPYQRPVDEIPVSTIQTDLPCEDGEAADMESVSDLLRSIKEEMSEIKSALSSHIKANNAQMMQLRDELSATKNHTTVCSKQIQNAICALCETSNSKNV